MSSEQHLLNKKCVKGALLKTLKKNYKMGQI